MTFVPSVVQGLSSYGGPVVDCCWDAAASTWSPWTPAPLPGKGAVADVRPTLEISRLQWFLQRIMKVMGGRKLVCCFISNKSD